MKKHGTITTLVGYTGSVSISRNSITLDYHLVNAGIDKMARTINQLVTERIGIFNIITG
jgi:hypothetical protein